MKLKNLAYSGAVVLSLASLALFMAQARNDKDHDRDKERGEKQLREAQAIGSTLEIHVTDHGKVLVRGAKVTSISGNTINASATWGSAVFNWAVVTDSSTELIRRFGGKAAISEISVGDFISFRGILDTSVANPITVKASAVKDWSIQKQIPAPIRTTLEGKIKSVGGTTTLPTTFVMTSGNKDYTVNVSAGTAVLNHLWLQAALSSFKAGDKIRVYGTVNANLTVEATVVRNVSL